MTEQRQFLRVDAAVMVRYRLRDASEPRVTTTVDVGGGGVCLLAPEPLPRGTYVDVELTLPGESRVVPFTAQVAWCESKPDAGTHRYRVGLEILFVDSKDHDALTRYCLKKLGGILPKPFDIPGGPKA